MKNKKNFLFALIGAGTLVLSAGVGFASWTITNDSDSQDGSLNISADTEVNDNRLVIVSHDWTDSSIQFKPVEATTTKHWLTVSGALKEEDLSAKFTISGKAAGNAKLVVSAKLEDSGHTGTHSYTQLTSLGEKFNEPSKKGIVKALPIIDDQKITANAEGNFSADITFSLSWGEAFNSKNPYSYYNSRDYSSLLADNAKTNLGYLSDLSKCSIKLTVTVSVDTTSSNN